MGINFYRLIGNTDYTLCMEILNTDQTLWNKTQISVDKESSTGLTIGNVGVSITIITITQTQVIIKNLCITIILILLIIIIIVNFKKLSSGNKFFLHILVNIPQVGSDLFKYPRSLLSCFRSPVKRQKLKPVLQANERYVVNVNAEITT